MIEREKLLKKIQMGKFSEWELHIFLDTHPDNIEALNKFEAVKAKNKKLTEEYERKYAPICEPINEHNRFAWISSPWPWENGEVEE